ncbi:MAG: LemA family protein [Bdellovibrio sp.]|nr:LemA family protein [Bdellovibrio sp.]
MFLPLIILIGVVLVFFLVVISMYNSLVKLRNRFKNAYSQIDVQLVRRYDLIPNLVETAKGYMKHEQDTLQKVIEARNQAQKIQVNLAQNPTDSGAMEQLSKAEGLLSKSMGSFFALAENYPDLKANSTMMTLMEELTSTENKVSFARQAYNDAVMEYNNSREVFPSSVIAGMFNFSEARQFEVEEPKARESIKVKF